MVRNALQWIAALFIGYALYLGLLFVQQRSMMFPGTSIYWDGVGRHLPAHAERVELPASFGRAQGVLLRAPVAESMAPAALYFHGNAEFVDQNLDLLQQVAALGMHVLLLEYPGYAGTDGRPTRGSLGETARLGYDWLAARPDVDASRMVAIGRSVGTGPAVDLAGERDLAALVLLAPFTSVTDFAWRMGAPPFLVRDRFDNVSGVVHFDGPLLVLHGRRDGIIPFAHGEAVAAASQRGQLLALDCGHNDCPFFGAEAMAVLRRFLEGAGTLP
ncbi:MAG TPA: alpha/beta hydrolase [Xanthomonadaceae bacterium]|nr:alpha/beta hydrolase [Xanthomonadaceae bacterium]